MGVDFRKPKPAEPEINLIPFIDVLLVILIFLMLSTTYSKFTELQISLPVADSEKSKDRPKEIIVSVAADGRYAVKGKPVDGRSVEVLTAELSAAANGAEHGVLLELVDDVGAGQAGPGHGDHLIDEGGRRHLRRTQAGQSLDDQCHRGNGAQEQRPDRPTGGLYDRK